jgi:SagB-type dehydrogenase family enzyme
LLFFSAGKIVMDVASLHDKGYYNLNAFLYILIIMRKYQLALTAVFLTLLLALTGSVIMHPFNSSSPPPSPRPTAGPAIELPTPGLVGSMSLEQALFERRSIRVYQEAPLALSELSQLLWAAQGVTHPDGRRTAASAGGTYPLELLAVVGQVVSLEAGVYRYSPERHSLSLIAPGDQRAALSAAALDQASVAQGAVVLALAGVYERTSGRYGQRATQYVHMEVGVASQNIHLQAVALGLGAVFIGAFADAEVQTILGLEADERPLCLMPVGRP